MKKYENLSGLLVTALVYLEAGNYPACKRQIEIAIKYLDDKLPIKTKS